MEENERKSYRALKARIIGEYDLIDLEEAYADQLSERKMKEGEDLFIFMNELKSLAEKAYPDFETKQRERIVMNQFTKSLSPDTRKQILLLPEKVKSCGELLSLAKKIYQVEQSTAPVVSLVQTSAENKMDMLIEKMDQLTVKVKVLEDSGACATVSVVDQRRVVTNRGDRRKSNNAQFDGTCYRCGDWGHMARQCQRSKQLQTAGNCGICGNHGHEDKSCAMRMNKLRVCGVCGSSGHGGQDCAMRGKTASFF